MAFPGTYNISYYQGDSYEFTIRPKTSDGSAYDLTDFSAKFYVANKRGSGATQYQCNVSISNGAIVCVIPPGVGRLLTAGTTYYYDVQIDKSAGEVIHTLLTGTISVTADVTGANA
jgi:hypothetical protein